MGIKPTSEKAAEYYWFGQKCLDLKTNGARAIVDGTYTIICKFNEEDAVLIVLGGGGIIFHPRSGVVENLTYIEHLSDPLLGSYPVSHSAPGVAGGWKDGVDILDSKYIFPLDDSDNASFVIISQEDPPDANTQTGGFAEELGNYGNLYWTNGKAGIDGMVVLSWKGTPTRHFRLPSNIDIPGFSTFETSVPGAIEDKPEYTAFGTKLYQNGEVFAEAPHYSWPYNDSGVSGRCLILGACQDAAGAIFIVCQSDHYNKPPKGFYLTLWKAGTQIDGWDLILEVPYSRNGLPWFGNASGNEFVCSNGDRLSTLGILTKKTAINGTYTETGIRGLITFKSDFTGESYHEFKEDGLVSSPVASSFLAESTASDTESISASDTYKVPVVVRVAEAIEPLRIIGPEDWSGNLDDYTIAGGGFPLGSTVTKKPPSGCNDPVSITITCPGGSATVEMYVRLNGSWILQRTETWPDPGANYNTYIHESGDTRIEEYVSEGAGWLWQTASVWVGCLYNSIDGCVADQQKITGVERNTGYGPQPEYSTYTAEPFVINGSFKKCEPNQYGPCNNINQVITDVSNIITYPVYKYLVRRRTFKYVCN